MWKKTSTGKSRARRSGLTVAWGTRLSDGMLGRLTATKPKHLAPCRSGESFSIWRFANGRQREKIASQWLRELAFESDYESNPNSATCWL